MHCLFKEHQQTLELRIPELLYCCHATKLALLFLKLQTDHIETIHHLVMSQCEKFSSSSHWNHMRLFEQASRSFSKTASLQSEISTMLSKDDQHLKKNAVSINLSVEVSFFALYSLLLTSVHSLYHGNVLISAVVLSTQLQSLNLMPLPSPDPQGIMLQEPAKIEQISKYEWITSPENICSEHVWA